MTLDQPLGIAALPPEDGRRIEALCNQFEAQWESEPPSSIIDFLRDLGAHIRPHALLELLRLELDLRKEAGERPELQEYLDRFPADAEIVARAFAEEKERRGVSPPVGELHQETCMDSDHHPAADTHIDLPEQLVPGYEVGKKLGVGGMGVVYLARQSKLKRDVALKVLKEGAHATAEESARFRRDAEAVARLKHTNIVQVIEVGQANGSAFMVLELVDGGSLDQLLTGEPCDPHDTATLLAPVARAIHHAHGHGIVHRDLKPANILLARIPETATAKPPRLAHFVPKVTDFGLAKFLDEKATRLTETDLIMGTISYMAPEQAAGQNQRITPRTDIWALGVILYELLTGVRPFRGPNTAVVLAQILDADPVPPRHLQSTVPRDLETICLKCLEKEPAKRYGTAAEVAADLERFVNGEPILARPVGKAEKTWRWCARNPAVAWLTAAVLILFVGGLALVTWQWLRAEWNLERAEDNYRKARSLQHELAQTMGNLGGAYLDSGQVAKALRDYERVHDILTKLVREYPDDFDFRFDLGKTLANIGVARFRLGQLPQATLAYERARSAFHELLKDAPEAEPIQVRLATLYQNVGNLKAASGDSRGEGESFKEASQLMETIVRRHPTSKSYQVRLADTYTHCGLHFQHLKNWDEAERRYQQALAILEVLNQAHPTEPEVLNDLARVCNNLGIMHNAQQHWVQAFPFLRRAAVIWEKLAADHPTQVDYHSALAKCLGNVTGPHANAGMFDEALSANGQAIAIQERLSRSHPELPELGRLLARFQSDRVDLLTRLIRLGNIPRATSEAETLASGGGITTIYNAACVFALAASKAPAESERYAARAVALLRQAVAHGWNDAAHMQQDTDLDPLRHRPDFQRLLAELERGAPVLDTLRREVAWPLLWGWPRF